MQLEERSLDLRRRLFVRVRLVDGVVDRKILILECS